MSSDTNTVTVPRAFAPFEWMVAARYLRARRKEGFISVIAGFSFLGIMLGVATLIIVMAVMNGFRQELFDKMLGLNGHVVVHSLTNFTVKVHSFSVELKKPYRAEFHLFDNVF